MNVAFYTHHLNVRLSDAGIALGDSLGYMTLNMLTSGIHFCNCFKIAVDVGMIEASGTESTLLTVSDHNFAAKYVSADQNNEKME